MRLRSIVLATALALTATTQVALAELNLQALTPEQRWRVLNTKLVYPGQEIQSGWYARTCQAGDRGLVVEHGWKHEDTGNVTYDEPIPLGVGDILYLNPDGGKKVRGVRLLSIKNCVATFWVG